MEPRDCRPRADVLERRARYWDNRFEIEAREFATDNLYRFRAFLRPSGGQPSSASRW